MQLARRLFDSGVDNQGGAPESTGGAPASTGGAEIDVSTGGSTGEAFSWNDGWRDRLAAGSTDSAKELKQLERYESPEQIWRKARSLEQRMSAGELRSVKPKDASDAELAKWREENDIPADPTKYELQQPDGFKPPKEDDPFLNAFFKSAHGADFTQGQVNAAVGAFYGEVARAEEATAEAEAEAKQKTEDTLRAEWGTDYRANMNMANALLARAPEEIREGFSNGYLDDHTPIKASPAMMKWLVQMEREINPAATVVPSAGGDVGANIATEIDKYKKWMGDDNSPYRKGGEGKTAEEHQAYYRDLIEAKRKLDERK